MFCEEVRSHETRKESSGDVEGVLVLPGIIPQGNCQGLAFRVGLTMVCMVGTNVGAEVFHIGSPSDQTGSDFQGVRSRSTQGLTHPTIHHQFHLVL